ncbi:hypothetical protein SPRG_02741 [Saprolegnia parasitica CBS 223.65]|uniref:DUF6604 domain-containing protein n=1 Tax=Saprolegnia parasitica (strain CBS 223.65) TaxID=695850 RepID=A0A067CZP8_SAPPC|nr:hypothetical protein SPRG_02741 [Saprolegnia parasitica CBS 223.65]KDO32262.1 hypothetical protein SPRG_02741 [Saprolegnia parasitica CBS 223.65]|eukprot:XP_012196718.1 hypothetical protein SPRG_02741 [Saprolegnia parasitica CBS 223.65]
MASSAAPADGSYGRWHRYKAATDAVLTWLERAASKASKKTKKQTTQKKVPMDMRTTGQIWAAAVAVAEAGIAVPLDVWRSLAVSIRLRWQATKSLPHDDGHLHFLTVLRAMQATLTPARPSPPIAATDELSNTFEALALDDDDDAIDACMPAFDVAAFLPPAAPTPQETALAQLEADQFRATCFLQDLDELLDEVDAVWTAFEAGHTSLVAATIVTNHVVHVAQSLASALTLELPYLDSFGTIDVLVGNSGALRSLVLQHGVDLARAVAVCEFVRWSTAITTIDHATRMAASFTASKAEAKALHAMFVADASAPSPGIAQIPHGSDLCSVHYTYAYTSRTAELLDDFELDRTSMRSLAQAFVAQVVPRLRVSVDSKVFALPPEAAAIGPLWSLLKKHSCGGRVVDMALVVASHCLLKAMMLVDDASLAFTMTRALKQQYKSTLVCMQNDETPGASPSILRPMSGWYVMNLTVATTKLRIFPSEAARDQWWFNPYMAGHFLLTSSTVLTGLAGHMLLNDVGQGRLVLHLYNALRIHNRLAPMIELDMLLDLLAQDKHVFPTGIPTTPGTFLAAYELSSGFALNDVTKAMRASPDRALETLRANAAHREKQDRRSNLQKALGRSTTRHRDVAGTSFSDLSRAYQYATCMQPLPVREGGTLPDLRELWRVADDEWRRFIQLDLMAMSTIMTNVAKAIAAEMMPTVSKLAEVNVDNIVARLIHSGRVLLSWCDLGNLEHEPLRNAASIITASSSKLQEAYIMPRSS